MKKKSDLLIFSGITSGAGPLKNRKCLYLSHGMKIGEAFIGMPGDLAFTIIGMPMVLLSMTVDAVKEEWNFPHRRIHMMKIAKNKREIVITYQDDL